MQILLKNYKYNDLINKILYTITNFQNQFYSSLLKNPFYIFLNSFTFPYSTISPYSKTITLSNFSIFSSRWVITIRVLFSESSNNFLCNISSVLGSILEVASSKQIISLSRIVTLRKFIIYFSPLDKFFPDSSI